MPENESCMLSTKDNPYNPFDDFGKWFMYDVTHGYNSCGLLARIAHTSDGLTDEENDIIISQAIEDILLTDITDMYIKVTSTPSKV